MNSGKSSSHKRVSPKGKTRKLTEIRAEREFDAWMEEYMRNNYGKKKSRKVRKSRKVSRKFGRNFGYSHEYGPRVFTASDKGGILLASNAFGWNGDPLARSLNSGSG